MREAPSRFEKGAMLDKGRRFRKSYRNTNFHSVVLTPLDGTIAG
jgi:hypothetical protein